MDFELIGAARPDIPLGINTSTNCVRRSRAVTDHGGFPDATIAASYNSAANQIEVRVREGRRCRCGEVRVDGQSDSSLRYAHACTHRRLETDANPLKGGPVPFDDDTVAELRKLLEVAFEESGFYRPDFEIRIDALPDSGTANLTVTVHDEGPQAVLGAIQMRGLKRNLTNDVLKILEVESGKPFSRRLPSLLERRLSESGRFLSVKVDTGSISEDPPRIRQIHGLNITLARIRRRSAAFRGIVSGPEEARCSSCATVVATLGARRDRRRRRRQRRARPCDDEFDLGLLQLRGSFRLEGVPSQALLDSRLALRLIVAPTRGQTISLQAIRPDGTSIMETVFAAYPDRLVLASPQRKAKLVLPNSAEERLCLNVGGKAASGSNAGNPFRINCGMGWSGRSVPDPSPFEVQLDFSAVFMLGLAHQREAKCTNRDGICKINNSEFELEIEATTGQPLEFRMSSEADNLSLTIRAQRQALNAELARLEGSLAASVPEVMTLPLPGSRGLISAVDELIFAAEQSQVPDDIDSLRTLRKLIHLWSPPAVADLFEPEFRPIAETDESFRLPTQRARLVTRHCA